MTKSDQSSSELYRAGPDQLTPELGPGAAVPRAETAVGIHAASHSVASLYAAGIFQSPASARKAGSEAGWPS